MMAARILRLENQCIQLLARGMGLVRAEKWLLPAGKIAALRRGQAVWIGNLGDPIEDIEADQVMLSASDYDALYDKWERDYGRPPSARRRGR